jgi:hypothetical protein
MSNLFSRCISQGPYLGAIVNTTKTGIALDTAYTYGVAGKAIAIRYCAPVSESLDAIYFFMSAHGGTPGNLTVELRNYLGALQPGATLHASQAVSPGTTDNKWIACTFSTPFSNVRGTYYFLVIGDPAGGAVNKATILDSGGMGQVYNSYSLLNPITCTDGFATAGTSVSSPMVAVLKFHDGTLLGHPYTTSANYTSNTLERGIKISGLTEDLVICGLIMGSASANISGLKIYSGTTIPGGTTELTLAFATGGGGIGSVMFAPFVLRKNTVYRIVLTFSASSGAPAYFINEDASQADCLACGVGGGTLVNTVDNNAGGWTDSPEIFPKLALLIQDQSVQPGALIDGGAIAT